MQRASYFHRGLMAGLIAAVTMPQVALAQQSGSLTDVVNQALDEPQDEGEEEALPPQPRPQPRATIPVQVRPQAQPPVYRPAPAPNYSYPAPATALGPQRQLDARIRSLGQAFSGDVGIAVKDLQTGWVSHFDGTSLFPQQSVSKFWVTLTALDKADRGLLNINAPVTMNNSDLTVFNQPIAALIRRPGGYTTTLDSLMRRAMQQSDNTANDFTLWKAGGPTAVRAFLAAKGIQHVRFGPGERQLQAQTAGLTWNQSYSIGNAFYAARASLPSSVRWAALNRYLADPMDGASPIGLVDALGKLKAGQLLSRAATANLLSIMSNTRTGPQRLKGGLSSGWRLAHKTGTGQQLGGISTGYNDIGIITGPSGRSYALAVMIKKTGAPIPQRMQLMQNVTRATIAYDAQVAASGYARGTGTPYGRANN